MQGAVMSKAQGVSIFDRAMRTALLVMVFFSLLLPPAASYAASVPDPLWNKAVEISRASRGWIPGSASFLLETVDEKGASTESWQLWYRIAPSPTGGVAAEVTRATHNGADATKKEQENQKKRKAMPFTMQDNPFDPAVQASVEPRARGETALVGERRCALYDFSMKKKDASVLTGTAWLDAESGSPVELRYTVSPLPRGLFEMRTTLRFALGPAGDGFLSEVLVEGVGGILFIRKGFRTVIAMDGYWRRESTSGQ